MPHLPIDLTFFQSKEWLETRTFSRVEALLHVRAYLEIDGKVSLSLRKLSDRLGWGMSRTQKFIEYLTARYPMSDDGKYIINTAYKKEATPGKKTTTTKQTLFGKEELELHPKITEIADYFIKRFNEMRQAPKGFKMNDALKSSLKKRIDEGYTSKDIFNALANALKDEYHVESDPKWKYITPEYILRTKVIDRYNNMAPGTKDKKTPDNNELTNAQKRAKGLLPKID